MILDRKEGVAFWLQKFAVKIICSGQVPQHIAIIMDGNRFAKKHNIQKIEGHSKGYNTLLEICNWCYELGIKETTVYAFSIENFKRTQEEVDGLMDLTLRKFENLLEEKENFMKNGIRIQVIGNLNMVPQELRNTMIKVMSMTNDNKKHILNFAFAYTGRDDIFQGVKKIVNGVADGMISPSDVTQDLLSKTLYTQHSLSPGLLIRTSGEVRLSDFLLWQMSCCCIFSTNVLWPDFSPWNFLQALLHYQRFQQNLKRVQILENRCAESYLNFNTESFVENLKKEA